VKGHGWFAAVYDLATCRFESKVLRRLRAWVAGEAVGRVLEVGVGTGADFPYYPGGLSVVAVDPDPFMLARARKRARRLGRDPDFVRAAAEALPFADGSFDTVVATLVFCSVLDPDRALAEVRRVLRPGGTFRFIEHVRARGGLLAQLQDTATPVWRRVAGGCHLNRRTVEAISAAGFELVRLEWHPLLFTPLAAGVARPR
jgi:ubiquinone/menaquinone biosynthesis C-methylase UbiE